MNRDLFQAAAQLVSHLPKQMESSWCFIAGFAYILHGVERKTKDMDIVTKNTDAKALMMNELRDLGYECVVCEPDYAAFTKSGVEVDIIHPQFCFVTQSPRFWARITEVDKEGSKYPTPHPESLVLLKMWTFLDPQREPIKRRNDLSDISYLITKYGLDVHRILAEAASLVGENPAQSSSD